MAISERINILLIEGNMSHIRLYITILQDGYNNEYDLNFVQNGTDALDFLHKKGKYSKATRPDIILMAMKIANENNFSVLSEIKNDKALKTIPVIILSCTPSDEDVSNAYENDTNFVIKKPRDKSDFIRIINMIEMLFFDYSKLPSRQNFD